MHNYYYDIVQCAMSIGRNFQQKGHHKYVRCTCSYVLEECLAFLASGSDPTIQL